jgi:hypothetical protein
MDQPADPTKHIAGNFLSREDLYRFDFSQYALAGPDSQNTVTESESISTKRFRSGTEQARKLFWGIISELKLRQYG